MSSYTTNPSIGPREVWEDVCTPMALAIQSETKRIEDLKRLVLGESRRYYRVSHLDHFLAENTAISADVSFKEPIRFMRITNRSCKYFFCCSRK
jgi:hypothetical protein